MILDRQDDTKAYLLDASIITITFILIIFVLSTLENLGILNASTIANSLLSQSGKWYKISLQNKDPIYALQHCDYALAYLNAARHSASDISLEKGTGIDLHKYHNKLISHQMQILKSLQKHKGKKISNKASWIT